ncbi:MAG: ABC transporter substrate-binding protein [Anaerolineae bacterium]
MHRFPTRTLVALLVIAIMITGLGVVAARLTTVAVPQVGGTYVEGVIGGPSYINPILCHYNPVDQDLVALIFSGLTTTDAQGVIIPDLAERWEISADGLRYTFHMRANARWHDGAPCTADDVVFTLQAIRDPDYQGPPEMAGLWHSVQVEAPDKHTVVFTLPEPFGPFLEYTTQPLLPSHVLSTVPAKDLPTSQFNAQPVGTGPYRVVETTATYVLLEANANYYGQRPRISRLQIMFFPDRDALFAAYRRGEIAGLGQVLPASLAEVKQNKSLNLYTAPFSGYNMVFLNLQRPVFQDPIVRRALWQAIDRQGLVDRFLNGQGIVVNGPILPNSWAYDPQLPRVAHDPKGALQALEEAGWVAGSDGVRTKDGVRLEFQLMTNEDDPARQQMIEAIARDWADIGVKAHTTALPMAELVRDHLYARNYDALLYGWDLPAADPDPYPLWHSSQAEGYGQNYVGYRDSQSDALLEQARRITDRQQRLALYRDFQRRFQEQAPSLILYQPVYNYAIDRQVKGVQVGPLLTTGDRFRTVCNWYIATKRVLIAQATAAQRQHVEPPNVAPGG